MIPLRTAVFTHSDGVVRFEIVLGQMDASVRGRGGPANPGASLCSTLPTYTTRSASSSRSTSGATKISRLPGRLRRLAVDGETEARQSGGKARFRPGRRSGRVRNLSASPLDGGPTSGQSSHHAAGIPVVRSRRQGKCTRQRNPPERVMIRARQSPAEAGLWVLRLEQDWTSRFRKWLPGTDSNRRPSG